MEDGDTIATQTLPNAWNQENKLKISLCETIAAPLILLFRNDSRTVHLILIMAGSAGFEPEAITQTRGDSPVPQVKSLLRYLSAPRAPKE